MGNYSGRQFTSVERSDIAERYEAGESMNALRIAYRCAQPAIRAALVEAGVTIRTHGQAFALATRTSGTVNTPIERRMQDALMAIGVGFTTQSLLLDRYLVDIEIRQAPVLIEADGAVHRLAAIRAKDAMRDAALAAAGYRVFRFTGSEINQDATRCVQQVVDACSLIPDAEPVYEVRTRFAGPLHPNWKGGLVEFTCAECSASFEKSWQHRQGARAFCNARCYGDWLRKHPETNHHRQSRAQRDWTGLAELYAAGMSIKQLGVHFGCSNRMVTSAMRDQGIPLRPIGGHRVKGGFYAAGVTPS